MECCACRVYDHRTARGDGKAIEACTAVFTGPDLHRCGELPIQKFIPIIILFALPAVPSYGQGNYEIQVYGSDTVAPGRTMVELHSNFTFEGFKTVVPGVLPDEHQLHETVEITQGWTSWFETGFYIFTSYGPHQGYKWVGDHIRPRVRCPTVGIGRWG